MIIKIVNKANNLSASPLLLEAKQDGEFLTLKDCNNTDAQGLFCGGLAVCYGVIIVSEQISLAHMSSINNIEFFNDMIKEATSDYKYAYDVILARSYYGYNTIRDFDRSNGHEELNKSAEDYFASEDKNYIKVFNKYFEKTPKIIQIPHDFLSITIDGHLNFFEQYHLDTLCYEEANTPTPNYNSSISFPSFIINEPSYSQTFFASKQKKLEIISYEDDLQNTKKY
jgi:hypothetical protein